MPLDWPGFARELKRRRSRLGLTQARLAERAGVRTVTIGRIEIATRRPSLDLLERLASALGCRVRNLIVERPAKSSAPAHRRKGGTR